MATAALSLRSSLLSFLGRLLPAPVWRLCRSVWRLPRTAPFCCWTVSVSSARAATPVPFISACCPNLLHVVAAKNLLLTQKLSFLSKRTTKEKLMAYLMEEARRAGSPTFRLPYDRQGWQVTWAWTAAPCRLS